MIHPEIANELARQRVADLQEQAARARHVRGRPRPDPRRPLPRDPSEA